MHVCMCAYVAEVAISANNDHHHSAATMFVTITRYSRYIRDCDYNRYIRNHFHYHRPTKIHYYRPTKLLPLLQTDRINDNDEIDGVMIRIRGVYTGNDIYI